MKHHHVKLTRIAATCKGNPLKASPIGILKEFFNYATPAEHAKAFDAFCIAALKQKYGWRRGSPGNALHYAEQLELLIEAAYLLDKNRQWYHTRRKQQQTGLEQLSPLPHNSAACADALQYLKVFFKQASLKKWKKWLHVFTVSALSDQSAADDISAVAIYRFTSHITQLLQMVMVIVKNNE